MPVSVATPARGGVGRHPTTDSDPAEDPPAPPPPPPPPPTIPLIAEILRTRRCVSGSVFLVEHIDDNIAVTNRYRTVRLLLGDGELCIQALLPGEMHPLVDSRALYAGCYVKANKFELRYFDLTTATSAAAAGKAAQGTVRRMAYLLVEDLFAAGWSQQYLNMLAAPPREASPEYAGPEEEEDEEEQDAEMTPELEEVQQAETVPELGRKEGDRDHPMMMMDDDIESGSDLDEVFEVMDVSVEKATQRREEASRPARHDAAPPSRQHVSRRRQQQQPWLASDPTKPLKLALLRSIPHLPYQQNWIVNVLAVVAWLSDVEPSTLPPYHQRRARLADPSTGKQVLLTVFLDPKEFVPRVGSVVLLIGLKNHRFDGGCLKKYASDRPSNGAPWWFEEPQHLEWCDVTGLKQWWESKDGMAETT